MKCSMLHTDIVTFIDHIDCIGFILKNLYQCLSVFTLSAIFLFQRKIITVGFLTYNYQIWLHSILRCTGNHLNMIEHWQNTF